VAGLWHAARIRRGTEAAMKSDRLAEICVTRIDHPRGDGLGRALILDCRSGSLMLLFDDPTELCLLIQQLSEGLAWVTERSRDSFAARSESTASVPPPVAHSAPV
jgi:hypothetical protein